MAGRSEPGITPACAGKSHWRLWRTGSDWDHPRMCGEKCPMCQWRRSLKGSPPHVRGKDGPRVYYIPNSGITPAYAGKSTVQRGCSRHIRDHPRVCGEKYYVTVGKADHEGSPPRMRGKVRAAPLGAGDSGITPACAGKRAMDALPSFPAGDHPRVCGEKAPRHLALCCILGSPPRVRGKARHLVRGAVKRGITPACAGKREPPPAFRACGRDHPRVCGEKLTTFDSGKLIPGSPPRVRGKVPSRRSNKAKPGITPACAGKR